MQGLLWPLRQVDGNNVTTSIPVSITKRRILQRRDKTEQTNWDISLYWTVFLFWRKVLYISYVYWIFSKTLSMVEEVWAFVLIHLIITVIFKTNNLLSQVWLISPSFLQYVQSVYDDDESHWFFMATGFM